MARYRAALPQLSGRLFLTDGGLETTLIFHDGFELPCFAAYRVLDEEGGPEALGAYFRGYAAAARARGAGFILESATWRASAAWGRQLGDSPASLAAYNRRHIAFLSALREELQTEESPIVISGCVGPRGDGYDAGVVLSPDEAKRYHQDQIATLASTEADLVSAFTMTHVGEAVGITRAAQEEGIPVVISFTVETDGLLPSGTPLGEAVERVDAATGSGPAYYMVNCAHPQHFRHALAEQATWKSRVRGIRANASTKSHAELDEAEELDAGDPEQLAAEYAALARLLPNLNVLGGCCGTDLRHVEAACSAWSPTSRVASA